MASVKKLEKMLFFHTLKFVSPKYWPSQAILLIRASGLIMQSACIDSQ